MTPDDQTKTIFQHAQSQAVQTSATNSAGVAAAYYLELVRQGVPPAQAAEITSAFVTAAVANLKK